MLWDIGWIKFFLCQLHKRWPSDSEAIDKKIEFTNLPDMVDEGSFLEDTQITNVKSWHFHFLKNYGYKTWTSGKSCMVKPLGYDLRL